MSLECVIVKKIDIVFKYVSNVRRESATSVHRKVQMKAEDEDGDWCSAALLLRHWNKMF